MTEKERLRGIIACIASTIAVTVTMGLTLPYLALVLEHQGVDPWLNGLSAAVQMVAVMFLAFLGPRLMARFGTKRVIAGGLVGVAVSLALLPVFPNVWLWFPIRFLLGLSSELVWTAGDVWINQLAPEEKRGRIIGITGFFQHGGFAVGPLLLGVLGTDTWWPLYIGTAIVLVGLAPLLIAGRAIKAGGGDSSARILHFLKIAPGLMIAGLMFGLIDSATLSLLPVYGLRKELSADMAESMLAIFVIGAMLAQIPMGWLTDHFPARLLMMVGATLTLVMLVAMPWTIADPVLIYPVLGLMGAGLGSFYTIALTEMGRRFSGGALIGVTTTFMFLWASGSVVGPGLSGVAIELAGPDGMPMLGAALTFAFMVLIAVRMRRGGDTV
jgi:MFS family permease